MWEEQEGSLLRIHKYPGKCLFWTRSSSRCSCSLQAGWTRWPLNVPSKPNYSMFLFYDSSTHKNGTKSSEVLTRKSPTDLHFQGTTWSCLDQKLHPYSHPCREKTRAGDMPTRRSVSNNQGMNWKGNLILEPPETKELVCSWKGEQSTKRASLPTRGQFACSVVTIIPGDRCHAESTSQTWCTPNFHPKWKVMTKFCIYIPQENGLPLLKLTLRLEKWSYRETALAQNLPIFFTHTFQQQRRPFSPQSVTAVELLSKQVLKMLLSKERGEEETRGERGSCLPLSVNIRRGKPCFLKALRSASPTPHEHFFTWLFHLGHINIALG